ncbi:MAG TPA: FIST N-terminal domain-containing protein [Candidatus Krumholzibacteria bacterium]|nr:FIST N-terminal domain-containing protein [Candidatus Krumholzibacteria bacterium]
MKFVSLSVTGENVDEILRDVSRAVLDRLGEHADFALVFPSAHFAPRAESLVVNLRRAIGARVMLGCTGEGVIGPAHEIEGQPAVAVVAAQLPGVAVEPFAIPKSALINIALDPSLLGKYYAPPVDTRFVVMLADPFSAPMDGVLNAFNRECADMPIIGGMASGARQPGETVLIMNDQVIREGLVGVSFVGPIQADIIVSQGCRPIGPVFEVTESKNNVIDSLGGESPLARIQEMLDEMDDEDRDLLQNGLFIGRAIDSNKDALGRGDFLIRGVLGVDSRTGAIAVSDVIDAGERVQFHLRDAHTAREDLEMMLSPHALFGEPSGAFLFSCNGRGTRLYDEPDGDISAIRGFFQGIDLAGFFCAGEIGPIGGKNFLHGHTASLALIRPSARDPRAR